MLEKKLKETLRKPAFQRILFYSMKTVSCSHLYFCSDGPFYKQLTRANEERARTKTAVEDGDKSTTLVIIVSLGKKDLCEEAIGPSSIVDPSDKLFPPHPILQKHCTSYFMRQKAQRNMLLTGKLPDDLLRLVTEGRNEAEISGSDHIF